ncbi:MAG TPA: hypothetical protein VHQ90_17660 [Thermoanaerobaculia bacterium]|nr:hypothetical protein [Thermoanaerobaculia bacterium]
MNRTVSQTARVLGVDVRQVKTWAWRFKEHLSSQANPPRGRSRAFTDSDVLALMHVAMHWEENPDIENIEAGLNCEDHYDNDRYRDMLYQHTPLLQEPPDDLDETWRHGIFLNGGGVDEYLELARSYKQSADALLDSALKSGEPRDWGYPVLFAYRHALELYLKIIGEIQEPIHSLEGCICRVEKRHRKKIGSPIREWIIELDKIDPYGTAFRYADDKAHTLKYAEYWVDFLQFKYAMSSVFEGLDHACLHLMRRRPY